jgi:Family of unknown function (DUF5994)
MLGTRRPQLGEGLDGAWWPHTASVAHELPELIGALSGRLGEIFDISINWSSLEGSPDLDAVKRASMANPIRVTSHQRLMMITGSQCSANLLVVPSRTSSAVAARAEGTLFAQRLRRTRLAHVDTADSVTTV